jgi:ABC-type multidrug transport system fused ATPase/permease subunit
MTNALAGACITVFSAAMLLATAKLQLPTVDLLLAPLAMISSCGPVIALSGVAGTLAHTFAAGGRILALLDERPVTKEITDGATIGFSGAACESVSFSYGETPVLQNISLEFPPGSIIGIQGKSGRGKSTLLRLLLRFWDAQGGQVYISGTDVRDINTTCLRGLESFVEQETHLFHGTIAENICIARADATREEMESACKKAAIHDFILTLPKGYDTPLGELGEGLSGGERQRIGLARAFLHGAPFLLLDEPTSNLDSLNEAVILHAISQARGEKTVVLVSHRGSTMGIADMVHHME